jgi:hypothetical protein
LELENMTSQDTTKKAKKVNKEKEKKKLRK